MIETNPYKCTDHHINLICQGCVIAWIARHNRMKDFIKDIANNEYECELDNIDLHAKKLLTEIGEMW